MPIGEAGIGSCPAFNCGVIFPKTIFGDTSVSDAEPAAPEVETGDKTAKQPVETEQETSDENQAETEGPAQQAESAAKQVSEAATETKTDDSDIAA